MAKHRLAAGAEVISTLLSLGRILGYFTKEEFPTEQPTEGGPAVDVAWLSDERQRFPIMIFEVESAATNSAANNPVKVFGPPNEQFEKPLFFFHVFLTGGANTSRLENLRRVFGTHNYRTYRLENGEILALLKDILSQHRRLSISFNIVTLAQSLESIPRFQPYVDEVLLHAESLDFEADYISAYAMLTRGNDRYLNHLARRLQIHYEMPKAQRSEPSFSTYLGDMYGVPIQLGFLHRWSSFDKKELLRQLKEWQEKSSDLTQIGPYFGLSYDYEQFILGLAPPFWAFIASLMRTDPDAIQYILKQCWLIFNDLNPSPYSAFWALWTLHIAASIKSVDDFERARKHINELGGLAPSYIYAPPSAIHLEGEDDWFDGFQIEAEQIPELDTFLNLHPIQLTRTASTQALLALTMSVLLDGAAFYEWAPALVQALAPENS